MNVNRNPARMVDHVMIILTDIPVTALSGTPVWIVNQVPK